MKKFLFSLTVLTLVAGSARAATVTIFDNMNRTNPPVTYNCCQGFGIEGQQNIGAGPLVAVAVAFTPHVSANLTEIDLPISYYSGTNAITVALYTDQLDAPGSIVKTWTFANLSSFNTCCTYLAATSPGTRVYAGRKYWVVVRTNFNMLNTTVVWNLNATDPTTPMEYSRYCSSNPQGLACPASWGNNQWISQPFAPGLAMAIFGQV